MPIDTQNLLLRLNPLRPIQISPSGGGGGAGMAREQLRLQRQRFEFEKQQHRENSELRRLEEAGANARESLKGEQARAQREAEAQAAALAEKREAFQSFSELNAKGDIEGARAMVPFMTSLGMGVDLEGEEAGLPRYRIEMDGAGAKARDQLQQLATAPPAARPSDEVFGATEESPTESLARLNAATSIQDDTGDGVPSNVIDMGSIQAQTLQRLGPALQGAINSYPEAYRGSAEETAMGVAGMGLPAVAALDTFHKLRGGPNSLIQSEIEAGAQQGRFEQTQQAAKERTANTQHERGWTAAKQAAATYNVDDLITARDQTKNAVNIITNEDPTDDHLVLSLISRRMGERGATTEGDIKRVTGLAAMSWIEQAKTWLQKGVNGGFSPNQRQALVRVLNAMNESDDKRFETYLDKIEEEAGRPDADQERASGMREYGRIIVPRDIRESYEAKRKKTADATSGASPIPETARIAREHNNPGNLKYVEQEGASKGEAAGDGGFWAKFDSYDDGLKALKAQVEKDAGRGLTVEQFVTKYAPPGSNDTAKYVADAVKALGTEAGKKLSELDLDKVTAFVAKKESGTEVDSAAKPASKASRLQELLKKGNY